MAGCTTRCSTERFVVSTRADEDNGDEFDLATWSISETARSVGIVDRPAVTITTAVDTTADLLGAFRRVKRRQHEHDLLRDGGRCSQVLGERNHVNVTERVIAGGLGIAFLGGGGCH